MADTGLKYSVDVSGLAKKLINVGRELNPAALLKQIGLRQMKWVDDNFRSDGALAGGWAQLSKNTIAGRRKGSSKPLQDSGILRASFTAGGKGNIFNIAGNEVTIGSAIPYASYHEEGTGPYEIRPIRAKFLRFMTADGPRFAKVVHHPGIPKRKILPTVSQARDVSIALIEAKVKALDNAGN